MPLGVNMAMRRSAIERAGGFDPRIGRKAGTLLGQEVREWCIRAHAAGLKGFYIPDIVVRHLIPAERLTKAYFRRWFFWRGISRAMLYAETGLDMEAAGTNHARFSQRSPTSPACRVICSAERLEAGGDVIRATWRANRVGAFERELWLWTFAGIVKQRWKDRHRPIRRRPSVVAEPHVSLMTR